MKNGGLADPRAMVAKAARSIAVPGSQCQQPIAAAAVRSGTRNPGWNNAFTADSTQCGEHRFERGFERGIGGHLAQECSDPTANLGEKSAGIDGF